MQKRTKSIVYIALGLFIAICLWISSYIFSTTDIQLFIEELLEILKTVEGKIYAELVIYSGIQFICYIFIIILVIKTLIKKNFTFLTSTKFYKTCVFFTAITAGIQVLKFQTRYTNYLIENEFLQTVCVAICFTLSIIYYFVYREDDYYVREAGNG